MLQLYRSERADRLVEALGDLLTSPLPDPMTAEVVAVPTRGVERWLTQRLSHRLGAPPEDKAGVCANISFPFPATLVGQAIAGACDTDPGDDPWQPERCVWTLIELMDARGDDPELAPLIGHLRAATPPDRLGQPGPLRRYAAARHIADLFDHYAVHRPDLLRSWAAGAPLPAGEDATPAWQAHLWRLLRSRLQVPSPAERFADAARRLTDAPDLIDLPSRVSLFGLTRLPPSHLEVLQAMACGREVHLFLLHPSGQLWDRVAEAAPDPRPDLPRLADPTARLPANPLLRSWGRDARELQLVLSARGFTGGEHRPVDVTPAPMTTPRPAGGERRPPVPVTPKGPVSLLGRLQADIRADRKPPGPPLAGTEDARPELDPSDRSLQIHSCHGRARQVEVARDAVLHLLAADETLEPRDVIVMCPDIETFAPLIHAAFGPDDPVESPDSGITDPRSGPSGTGLPRLRVRLADRSVRQTNPLLGVAASLLDLAGARVTASEVARPGVAPAGGAALPFRPGRSVDAAAVGDRHGRAVGPGRAAPPALGPRPCRGQHVGHGSGPAAAGSHHGRGRRAHVRRHAPVRRRGFE